MESSAAQIGGGVPVPGRRRSRRRPAGVGGVGPLGLGITMVWLSLIVLLPLAALTVKALDGGLGGIWDAISAPSAQGGAGADGRHLPDRGRRQRGGGHADRLGARPRRVPRQGAGQRGDRPALRAAHHRGQHRAALALRPAEPDRRPPLRHAARAGGRAAVRDAAVRGPVGAAGADGGGPRGRGGRRVARSEQARDLPADHPAGARARRCSAAPAWPSPGRSASSAPWC